MILTSDQMRAPAAASDFHRWAIEAGWSDGLPMVPPTEDLVAEMVAASGLAADDVLGEIPPELGVASVEKVAVNAVLAGCRPEWILILVAAVRALLEPGMNLAGIQTTTNPCAPAIVVNGPIRRSSGIACGINALGAGHEANQTLGRALRLVLRNIGRCVPPWTQATLGSPWQMGLVVGENEEESPWPSHAVESGFRHEENVITVWVPESVVNVAAPYESAEEVLLMLAHALAQGINVHFSSGKLVVLLTAGHARLFANAGYDKARLRRELFEAAKLPPSYFPNGANMPAGRWARDIDGRILVTSSDRDIIVVVAGSQFAAHSLCLPGWALSGLAMRRVDPAGPERIKNEEPR